MGLGLVIAFLIVSLGVHEAAHGWTALKFGDTTARDQGRITLNPFNHIDPFMTILVPLITWFAFGFPFGGARPVPVNIRNLRRPLRDMAVVALAGPASNVLLAALFLLASKVLVYETGVWPSWREGGVGDAVLYWCIVANLLLAAFNLVPIPPLDGSRVMTWILPSGLREPYMRLETFGLLILILAIQFVPQLWQFIGQTMELLLRATEWVVTLGGAW